MSTSSKRPHRTSPTWSDWRTATAAAEAVALLGLGTNLGDRASNLRTALDGLAAFGTMDGLSRVYESEPFGITEQPMFLNMAARLRTPLAPRALLDAVKELETRMGRVAAQRMGPRMIDIDILIYDDIRIDETGLHIPHEGIMDRSFVIAPLLDLDPQLRHPATGASLRDQLERLGAHATLAVPLGSATDVLGLDCASHEH